MSNVEGAWAVGFIPKGAELPIDSIDDVLPMRRTKSKHEANCKLIMLEEVDDAEGNPQRAVVMLRDIQESEFFLLWDDVRMRSGCDARVVERKGFYHKVIQEMNREPAPTLVFASHSGIHDSDYTYHWRPTLINCWHIRMYHLWPLDTIDKRR